MTDQTPAATVTVMEQLIELRVTGQPDVKNKYGSGHVRPTEVSFRYRPGGVRAQVYGHWVREGGELTDAPCSQDYAAHEYDMADWPEWLAALAVLTRAAPAAPSAPADRTAILRDFLWRLEQSAGDAAAEKFLDDNPELRRRAGEAQQPETQDSVTDPSGCRWCGISQRDHMQRWKPPVGWHTWEQPTQEQTKARMRARRTERTRP
jgi:hypothetical protein